MFTAGFLFLLFLVALREQSNQAPPVAGGRAVAGQAGLPSHTGASPVELRSIASSQTTDAARPARTASIAEAAEARRIVALARDDIAGMRLTTPPGNNALERLRAAAILDPSNRDIPALLTDIASSYLALAVKHLGTGNWQKSLEYLDRGLSVNPGDSRLMAEKAQIEQAARISPKLASCIGRPRSRPTNGTTLRKAGTGYSDLQVENGLPADAIIRLITPATGSVGFEGYVHARSTARFDGIPPGRYKGVYATGSDFVPGSGCNIFAAVHAASVFDGALDFTQTRHPSGQVSFTSGRLTLHEIDGGNIEARPTDATAFYQ